MRKHNSMQFESAFYGKELTAIGQYYYKPLTMSAAYPDILFFCLYTTSLLVLKKLPLSTALEIQKRLAIGAQWEKVLNLAEDRPFTLPFEFVKYRGLIISGFSSSMIMGKSLYFRLGYCGFGYFTNKRAFTGCAAASVYAMLEMIYRKNEKDEQFLNMFWRCVTTISNLEFGKDLHNKNHLGVAQRIYVEITQDSFPGADYA